MCTHVVAIAALADPVYRLTDHGRADDDLRTHVDLGNLRALQGQHESWRDQFVRLDNDHPRLRIVHIINTLRPHQML